MFRFVIYWFRLVLMKVLENHVEDMAKNLNWEKYVENNNATLVDLAKNKFIPKGILK